MEQEQSTLKSQVSFYQNIRNKYEPQVSIRLNTKLAHRGLVLVGYTVTVCHWGSWCDAQTLQYVSLEKNLLCALWASRTDFISSPSYTCTEQVVQVFMQCSCSGVAIILVEHLKGCRDY